MEEITPHTGPAEQANDEIISSNPAQSDAPDATELTNTTPSPAQHSAEACPTEISGDSPREREADYSLSMASADHFRRCGNIEAAAAVLEVALAASAAEPDVYHRLADVYREAKHLGKAKDTLTRAVSQHSDSADTLSKLGAICQELRQFDEAVGHFEAVVRLRPDGGGDWNNLGIAFSEQRQFAKAIECYEKALSLDPKFAFAWNNVGNALGQVGRYQESLEAFAKAVNLKPDYAEAYNNRGVSHIQVGEYSQAEREYDRALLLRPNYPEAHANYGLELLLRGQFRKGWSEYEWRWKGKDLQPRSYGGKRWDGSPLTGKRILIYHEQGLGDTIQFVRYVMELKARGATVFVECQKPLCKLLSRTPGIDKIFHRRQKPPETDFYAPMLSLPGLFKTELETIPSIVPYVFTHPELLKTWKERLSTYQGFKVGVVWQGNPQHRGDRKRSIPLAQFQQLALIPGVKLISLQKGHGVEQIASVNEQFEVVDLAEHGTNEDGFLRTAAIIKNLDLVIAADTSVAHLTGALGVPVWIALPYACDWRWLLNREDSPWYPTLRLFRQQYHEDWKHVFDHLENAMKHRLAIGAAPEGDILQRRSESQQLYARGKELLESKKPGDALDSFAKAVQLDDGNFIAHHDLGLAFLRLRQFENAARCFRKVIELKVDCSSAFSNLGAALLNLKRYAEAANSLKKAIQFGVSTPAVHNNLCVALMNLGDLQGAEESCHNALRLRPDYAGAHYNLAQGLLKQGRLKQGFVEYEWRWHISGGRRRLNKPRWVGEELGGRAILLHAEQGLGDTLQFVRFAAAAKQRGGHVVVECQPPLAKILRSCPFLDEIVAKGDRLPEFDVHLPLMSVPAVLSIGLADIPAPVPYVSSDPNKVSLWERRLFSIQGYRVGIVWQGNPKHPDDWRRSIPLMEFAPLAAIPGVRLISLQRGFGIDQLKAATRRFEVLTPEIPADEDPFSTTAAIVQNLNLVITADTAIAHLAGAMGVGVWVAIPNVGDWRWMSNREDSPWYPSMRLFRQRSPGAWRPLFEHMARCLTIRMSRGQQNSSDYLFSNRLIQDGIN